MKRFKPRLRPGQQRTAAAPACRQPQARKQRGFTLIEILITLVVLAIGALGLAALQGVSLQSGQTSYLRTQATNLAYEVTDYTRANRSIATSAWVETEFQPRVAAILPGGTVAVDLNAFDQLQVTITWQEDRQDGVAAGTNQVFVVNTQI